MLLNPELANIDIHKEGFLYQTHSIAELPALTIVSQTVLPSDCP